MNDRIKKFGISEKILYFFSRDPSGKDYPMKDWDINNSLNLLTYTFPDFIQNILGKKVVDFGCGEGFQVAALAKNGAELVVGIDNNIKLLKTAHNFAVKLGISHMVQLYDTINDEMKGNYDIVLSQNSMEHFSQPDLILNMMISLLRPEGKIYITFAPPWYAPYGSHTHFFTKLPWVNILFPEKTVMNVRSLYRNDGARKYEEIEGGLNRMTVNKFEKMIKRSGLKFESKQYYCIKRLDFLGKIPYLRELFINQISCILTSR
jgi:SAM-dependent methyltransferase